MSILNELEKCVELKKIAYFFTTLDYRAHDALNLYRAHDDEVLMEKLEHAYPLIKEFLCANCDAERDLRKYIKENHPYSDMLLESQNVPFELVAFCLLFNSFSVKEFLGGTLETLPNESSKKYKIVKLDKGEIFTHEGVKHNDKFYYFSPFVLNYKRLQSEPTELIKLLTVENSINEVWLRLDDNLSIPLNKYKPNYRLFASVYWGKEINLDKIEFPYQNDNISLSVYRPETMKRIQFKISNRKDNEKWIEVEELHCVNDNRSGYITKYLHSIYNPDKEVFEHIDGSLNFYSDVNYRVRSNSTINAHSDAHEKLWLVEGVVSKEKWVKLIYRFFEDDDLISDAFTGKLSEDILTEVL